MQKGRCPTGLNIYYNLNPPPPGGENDFRISWGKKFFFKNINVHKKDCKKANKKKL